MENAMEVKAYHRVNFYDTDAMGVVHHANYIRWFEIGSVEFLRALGKLHDDLFRTLLGKEEFHRDDAKENCGENNADCNIQLSRPPKASQQTFRDFPRPSAHPPKARHEAFHKTQRAVS